MQASYQCGFSWLCISPSEIHFSIQTVCRISICFESTCSHAGFTLVCVLMSVMKLSTCHHKSSGNKLETTVLAEEINPERSHSCAGFSSVCVYMALMKMSVYSQLSQWKYVCHYKQSCL